MEDKGSQVNVDIKYVVIITVTPHVVIAGCLVDPPM